VLIRQRSVADENHGTAPLNKMKAEDEQGGGLANIFAISG
jgi:hypothetical protein